MRRIPLSHCIRCLKNHEQGVAKLQRKHRSSHSSLGQEVREAVKKEMWWKE